MLLLSCVKRAVKNTFLDAREKRSVGRAKKREMRKFEDPKRRDIYSKVKLTKEQEEEIDHLYQTFYGEKIPYVWHRHYTAFTGRFDAAYFPELLYIPEFERYMNEKKSYVNVFGDKNILPLLGAATGIYTPACIISCVGGQLRNGQGRFITEEEAVVVLDRCGIAFAKPTVESNSGHGCALVEFINGKERFSGQTTRHFLQKMGSDFVVQELVTCHESLRKIHAGSVNTFRVITYRWMGKIEHMPIILRIGQGDSFLDNAHAGGMFIAVNDDGTLHETAFTEFAQRYTRHPDSGVVYDGYRIEHVPSVIGAAHRAHEMIPQIGVINWDFTIGADGEPILIEANTKGGSVWLIEMAHGRGAFGERTKEVLQWLKEQKQVRKSQRGTY